LKDLISVESVGDETWVVTVTGSISFSTNEEFRAAIEKVLEEEPGRLLINLEDLRFCNSQGFGDMLRAYTRMAKSGGGFGLISPAPEIRKVLEITKFAKIIDVYPTVDAALAK
jgi:anti-sigma B factor antagonist